MNRRVSCLIVLTALLLVPWVADAQEEAAPPFIYSSFGECILNDQWLADKIVENAFAPAVPPV